MSVRVLIVDDSSFFRKRLTEIISADSSLEVIGEAKDGKEGVEKTISLRPDVVTMDVEMPVMDGITAVKEIMSKSPTPILMFSSLTFEGANSTFKALEAGAVDFMPKNFDDIAHKRDTALQELRAKIKAVAKSRVSRLGVRPVASVAAAPVRTSTLGQTATAARTAGTLGTTARSASSLSGGLSATAARPSITTPRAPLAGASAPATRAVAMGATAAERGSTEMAYEKIQSQLSGSNPGRPATAMQFTFGNHKCKDTVFKKSGKRHDIIAIGSSTGGPIALQSVIPKLPLLNVPIVIVQHMPGSFTTTFAQRLDNISNYKVVEAKDGDILEPNVCYIAPGGMQMIFERGMSKTKIRILKGDSRVVYHPCVDVSFASLASIYSGRVLAMILTGMGSDGCEGSRLLKRAGSVVWAQNEDPCVVYRHAKAIVNAGIADHVMALEKIAPNIVEEMGH